MKLKTALLAAAATVAIAPAAHAYEGLYGAIGAGLSYLEDDLDVEATSAIFSFDSDQNTDNGIGIYTTLGKYLSDGWRAELEFSYRNNDARSWVADIPNISAFPEGTMSGDISSYALMLNVIKDLDFVSTGWVTPYVGGGIGLAHVDTEIVANRVGGINGLNNLVVNSDDRVFAYQGIAGLAFSLAENLMLDVSYRYFATADPSFDGVLSGNPFKYEGAYISHSAFAGLRWNFGASAPAVSYKDCWDGSSVPVSSDCPPQVDQAATAEPMQVIVYFDYDKSNLTPEAEALIRETAQRALAFNINTVKVEGNADRSGGSAYNQGLSQRRANVVRDALVANGVPGDRIEISAFGEDNPAKPTADGVREPLNRRTEVRITFM
jgi:outer membrane protein OmpA-like peptidoglycan-associated protein